MGSEITLDIDGETAVRVKFLGFFVDVDAISVKKVKKESTFTLTCAIVQEQDIGSEVTETSVVIPERAAKRTTTPSYSEFRMMLPPVDLFRCAWLRTKPGRKHRMREKKQQLLDTRSGRSKPLEPIALSVSDADPRARENSRVNEMDTFVREDPSAAYSDPLELFNTPRSSNLDLQEKKDLSRIVEIRAKVKGTVEGLENGCLVQKDVVFLEHKELMGRELGENSFYNRVFVFLFLFLLT